MIPLQNAQQRLWSSFYDEMQKQSGTPAGTISKGLGAAGAFSGLLYGAKKGVDVVSGKGESVSGARNTQASRIDKQVND